MGARVVIPARFNGPPSSGNGGYSCGVLGTLIGERAEVTLRAPPPLERELSIDVATDRGERRWRMMDGESVVAIGREAAPGVTCPEPPSLDVARAAESAYIGFDRHPFATCFVCGPDRSEGDGLRLFTGKVEGRDLVASAWTPARSVGAGEGTVDRAVVWSALDCPTYFGGRLGGSAELAVLGRLTVELISPVKVGVPHVVVGWHIGKEGRKSEGGSAIFTGEGELCAFAKGLWIELKS